ncbi:MAG: DDE-type integrase/transposase/recombinase [Desulfobacterales bacterium]
MTEDEKMQVAIFRYGVISDFVNGIDMSRAEKRRLMRDKCDRKWPIPFSQKTRISKETINHWIRIYNGGGVKGLRPKDRSDQGHTRAMDEDTCESLIRLRKEMPAATVPHLIEQMNQRQLVTPATVLSTTTVYRFLHGQDLMRLTRSNPVDRRKFEAELPNDLWQSDVMHGPKVDVDGRQKKTYLIAILDDHSRLIVYARFYLSENLASYLDAFENGLSRRGLPRKLYVDNGAAFRSKHLQYTTASLAITLIHAKPYQPQGKGKIERWFKTVRSRLLPYAAATTLLELNGALDRYLNNDYHQRKHSATGQTPLDRFTANMHCLRPAPENLKDHFRKVALRKVNGDRTVTLDGRIYEAPVALIGKRIELLYHQSDVETIEVRYKNKSYGMLRPVDLAVNYRVKRDKNNHAQIHVTNATRSYEGGKLWSSKGRKNGT